MSKKTSANLLKTIPTAAFILDILLPFIFVVFDFSPWALIFYFMSGAGPVAAIIINAVSVRNSIVERKVSPKRAIISLLIATLIGAILGAFFNIAKHGGQFCSMGDYQSCMDAPVFGILISSVYCLLFAQGHLIPAYISAGVNSHKTS